MVGKEFAFETLGDQVFGSCGLAEIGVDSDDAAAVGPFDRREGFAKFGIGHDVKRDRSAVFGAQAHFTQGVQAAALVFGIANHGADFIASALNALGFDAEEGRADGVGEVALGEPGGFSGGVEVDLDFRTAGAKAVAGIEDSGIAGDFGFEFFGGSAEVVKIVACELE